MSLLIPDLSQIDAFGEANSSPIPTNNPDSPLVSILGQAASDLFKGGVDALVKYGEKQLGVSKVDPATAQAQTQAKAATGGISSLTAGLTPGQIALYGGGALIALAAIILIVKSK